MGLTFALFILITGCAFFLAAIFWMLWDLNR